MEIESLKSNERITHLDGLRGILAIVVFIHHFLFCFSSSFILGGESPEQVISGSSTYYKIIAYSPLNLFYNPGMAVGLFFIISGYVLSFGYFKTNNIQLVRTNALKRYFRLSIPVLGSCLLTWMVHALNLDYKRGVIESPINRDWLSGILPDSMSFWMLPKYALFDVFTGDSKYNPVLWTMSRELTGSFLVFAILLISHKISFQKKTLLIFAVLIFQIIQGSLMKNFTLGIILCLLQTNSPKYTQFLSSTFLKIFILIIGVYIASYPYYGVRDAVRGSIYKYIFCDSSDMLNTIRSIGSSLLLLVFLNSKKTIALFQTKLFSFFGKISFGLYLMHIPVILVFSTRIYAFFYKYMYDLAGIPLTFLLTFVCLSTISWLFYFFVDRYAIKLASKFADFLWL